MLHWRARKLLDRELDEPLPPDVEIELDAHVASCARCRRIRREHALAERLLAGLPPSFAPYEFDPGSYARLVSLTRWSELGEPPTPHGYTPPILALATATTIVMLAATVGLWSPVVSTVVDPVSFVSLETQSIYSAASWHTGRF